MALEVIFGASIPRELTTPTIEFLWAKWKTLKATNHLNLQRLTEESRHSLRPNLAYLISTGDSFAYLYLGEAVQAGHGNAQSGHVLSDNIGPRASDFMQVYREVAARMTPAFVRFSGESLQPGQLWVRIILPIEVAEGSVMLVCYSEVVSHQMEVYEQLFRTAPDAMLIACPICNDAGHTTDGWVTMMNDRACELLRHNSGIANLRLSEIPQFRNIDLWGRLYGPRPGGGPQVLKTDDFELEILRFPHAFGLRLRQRALAEVNEAVPLAPVSSSREHA